MELYTPEELRQIIAKHAYSAELLLVHAMLNIRELERKIDLVNTMLDTYSEELKLPKDNYLTVPVLINSHKRIRASNKMMYDKEKEILERFRKLGEEQGRKMITEGEYIKVSKFKTMSVYELAELIIEH